MIVRDPTPEEIKTFRIRVPKIVFGEDRQPSVDADTAPAWEPRRVYVEGINRIRKACR